MKLETRSTVVALVIIVGLIGWAGLRPFDFARVNSANWIKPGPGMRFEDLALAYSQTELQWSTDSSPASMTIEIWLRADSVADAEPRTWLVFVDDSQLTPLGFRQEGSEFVVWDAVTNPGGDRWYNDFRVPNAIRSNEVQYFAVTSDEGKPRLYVDGSLAETSEGFSIPFARKDEQFAGTLVIGAGPPWDVPWSGEILGLALYGRVLTADVIKMHAGLIPGPSLAVLAKAPGIMAFFGFDAQGGAVVRDHAGQGNDLMLPEFYHPPRRQLLAPFDLQDWATGWFVVDVLVNLCGFVCFGFLLASVLQKHVLPTRLIVLVSVIGFCMSLTIELTQILMVSRASSLQDLTLNTIGALAGAAAKLRFYLAQKV
jgi:hypothetical protein